MPPFTLDGIERPAWVGTAAKREDDGQGKRRLFSGDLAICETGHPRIRVWPVRIGFFSIDLGHTLFALLNDGNTHSIGGELLDGETVEVFPEKVVLIPRGGSDMKAMITFDAVEVG